MALFTHTAAAQQTRPAAPAVAAEELWAEGSPEQFWIARALPSSSSASASPGLKPAAEPQTDLFVRARGDPAWQRATPLPMALRITALSHRGPQAVVVLDGGQWMLLTGAGASTGQPLPHAARLLAMAGGGETVWALGLVPPAPPRPATRSFSTAPSSTTIATAAPPVDLVAAAATTLPAAATQPGTQADFLPGPSPKLVLYELKPAGWVALAALPADVKAVDEPERFAVTAYEQTHELYVAVRDPAEDTVRVLRLGADRQWQPRAQVGPGALPSRVRAMRLLGLGDVSPPGPPVLWLAGEGGEERLYFLRPGEGGAAGEAPPAPLDLPAAPGATARTAVFANGAIRLLRVVDGKLYEQSVEPRPDARPGEAKPVVLPSASTGVVVTQWINVVLTVALGFAIVATLLRRRETQRATQEAGRLNLAPLGRRVIAGLIDALPLLVTFVVVLARRGALGGRGMTMGDALIVTASGAVYVLHTAVGELLTGRSLGKWVLGLRVVGLDGRRAPAGAVVVRNLLRVIDIAMMFLPLVLVAYSPLRQRPGDVAAGTVVVSDRPAPTGPDGEGGSNDDDEPPPPSSRVERKSDDSPDNQE